MRSVEHGAIRLFRFAVVPFVKDYGIAALRKGKFLRGYAVCNYVFVRTVFGCNQLFAVVVNQRGFSVKADKLRNCLHCIFLCAWLYRASVLHIAKITCNGEKGLNNRAKILQKAENYVIING
jgi:hypothetical protein